MMTPQASRRILSSSPILALVCAAILVLTALSGAAQAQPIDHADAYQNSISVASDASVTEAVLGPHLVALDADDLAVVANIWQRRVQTNLARIADGVTRLEQVEAAEVDDLVAEIKSINRENIRYFQNYLVVVNALGRKGGNEEDLAKHQKFISGFIGELLLSYRWIEIAYLARDWVLSGSGGLRALIGLLQAAVIVGLAFLLGSLVKRFTLRWLRRKDEENEIAVILVPNVLRWGIVLVGVLVSMALLGFNIGVTTAVIGGLGFLAAFMLQSFFQSVIGGFLLQATNPYARGDIVSINQTIGTVVDVNVVATKLKTFDNRLVQIPNQAIWQGSMENFTKYRVRRVDLVFGIGYEADVAKAKGILTQMIGDDERCLKSPEARVFVGELAASSVNVYCRPWVRTDDYWDVYWDLTERGKTLLQEDGILIAYPQMDVHVHNKADTLEKK